MTEAVQTAPLRLPVGLETSRPSAARVHLDLELPVGVLVTGVLHHLLNGRDRPVQVMARYIDQLPVGSYVAITHHTTPDRSIPTGVTWRGSWSALSWIPGWGPVGFRTETQVLELFGGLNSSSPDWWNSTTGGRPAHPRRGMPEND